MTTLPVPPRLRWLPPTINWQWVSILVLALIVLYDNRGFLDYLRMDFPAVKAGNRYRDPLCLAWADAFEAAGAVIASGGTVQDAEAVLKEMALLEHQKAFARDFAPAFAALVPAGTQPKDDATRTAFARMFHDFATGLRRRHWWGL